MAYILTAYCERDKRRRSVFAHLCIYTDNGHLHLRKGCGNVCKNAYLVLRDYLKVRLVDIVSALYDELIIPSRVYPSVLLLGLVYSRDSVRTVFVVDRNSVALRYKAYYVVTGQGVTAAGKLDLTVYVTVNNDATVVFPLLFFQIHREYGRKDGLRSFLRSLWCYRSRLFRSFPYGKPRLK